MRVLQLISRLMDMPAEAEVSISLIPTDGRTQQLRIEKVSALEATVYLECSTRLPAHDRPEFRFQTEDTT